MKSTNVEIIVGERDKKWSREKSWKINFYNLLLQILLKKN
jgi:hypothetical protein